LSDQFTEFEITSPSRPRSLTADPDYHLFRRLALQEMPPTVNTLKGSASVVMVIADRMGPFGPPVATQFARAMGIDPVRTIRETDFTRADASGSDLVFIGLPDNPLAFRLFPQELELVPKAFKLEGQPFEGPADALFIVARHPRSQTVVALLHPLSADTADLAALKIPHYGRYSYLAFSQGHNRVKGTWPAADSPVMVRWDPAGKP
jgi:hypothetical protein